MDRLAAEDERASAAAAEAATVRDARLLLCDD